MAQLLQNGDLIDKYRVEYCLGSGGMGEVYLVTHTYLNVLRALKILRMDLTEDDPTFRDRFVQEARMAARFQHPNSIGVVDVESSSESGFLYLVMEYVNGLTLHQCFQQNGVLEEKQMLHICREVARALDSAWKNMKLVHRDIKPGNIMISQTGEVKLADLGIAKSSGGSGMTMALTMAGTMIGTPEYASPEQCRDASTVDTRADIYSLGATMYEMLTGVRPFSGTNAFDTVAKVLQEPLVPVRQHNPNISEETAALIERMMAKSPSKRPQSMEKLIEILDGMLADEDTPALPEIPQEVLQREVEQLAEKMTGNLVKSAESRLKWRHVWCTFAAFLLAAFDIYLGYTYIDKKINKYGTAPKVEVHPGKTVVSEKKQISFHDRKVNNISRIGGCRYSTDGRTLLDFVYPPERSFTVPEWIEQIHPIAIAKLASVQNLYIASHQVTYLVPFIHEFRMLRDVIIYVYPGENNPEISFPNNARVHFVRRYTRNHRILPQSKKIIAPVSVPAPEKKENVVAAVSVPETPRTEKKEIKQPIPPVSLLPESAKTEQKPESVKPEPVKPESVKPVQRPTFIANLLQKTGNKIKKIKSTETADNTLDILKTPAYKRAIEKGMTFSPDGRILLRYFPKKPVSRCEVPEGVVLINHNAFNLKRKLETVILPSTVEEIHHNAFNFCVDLRHVSLPAGLKRIGNFAFAHCRKLKLEVPAGVYHIGYRAFYQVHSARIAKGNRYYFSDLSGGMYEKKTRSLIYFPYNQKSLSEFSPLQGTKVISLGVFAENKYIRRITLPPTVERIEKRAFYGCSNLRKINIPDSVKMIGRGAFSGCFDLKKIELPKDLTIQDRVFEPTTKVKRRQL